MIPGINFPKELSKPLTFCFVDFDSSFSKAYFIKSCSLFSASLCFFNRFHFNKVLVLHILNSSTFDFEIVKVFTYNSMKRFLSNQENKEKFQLYPQLKLLS